MIIEHVTIELVGGPADGQRRVVLGELEVFEVEEFDGTTILTNTYTKRRINGISVRLPSGLVPYDWRGVTAVRNIRT